MTSGLGTSVAHLRDALIVERLHGLAYRYACFRPVQNGRETLDPTPDRDMVHGEAALHRYLLQIPVAERIPQVPADTQ